MFQVSLAVNCGCIIVAVVSACLIGVDLAGVGLAFWPPADDQLWRVRQCEGYDKYFHIFANNIKLMCT